MGILSKLFGKKEIKEVKNEVHVLNTIDHSDIKNEGTLESQNKMILRHLTQGNSITPIDALNLFGCFRLSARVHDLKADGHNIKTDRIARGNKRYAQYTLIKD